MVKWRKIIMILAMAPIPSNRRAEIAFASKLPAKKIKSEENVGENEEKD